MNPKAAVVVYPGTNCDRDTYYALELAGFTPEYVDWHGDVKGYDLVVLPGGFSYGDYLRAGAVAAREPVSKSVRAYAEKGGLVLGICNGFQVLMEMGLLPGGLLENTSGTFICKWVDLEITDTDNPFLSRFKQGEKIKLPIAHAFGRYVKVGDPKVALRYVEDVNGSDEKIAGILSEDKNIFGLMPHPERAMEKLLGWDYGKNVFLSILDWIRGGNRVV
ncbi:phosphoribosylformylglycinamidine synthase subunit PurQ [bacterium 3DAC]|nr:phosphoribosylformylglycinamidine synthase subunit PurQ [Dictyoglomota bacterium]UZN23004.1 phosphoribosylformylglycinamidine synthase subunit PurQ [bacterium 3DAC]